MCAPLDHIDVSALTSPGLDGCLSGAITTLASKRDDYIALMPFPKPHEIFVSRWNGVFFNISSNKAEGVDWRLEFKQKEPFVLGGCGAVHTAGSDTFCLYPQFASITSLR